MKKLLTITIPTYNTEQYLPRCIESLIVPSFMDQLEILVVIDGSPDNSAAVARKYEEQYPDTIKVIEKENGGHGSTINKGVELASGKYFRVLDSDDWFDTAEFEKYLKELVKWDVDFVLNPYRKYFVTNSSEQLIPVEGNHPTYQMLDVEKTDFSNLIGFKFILMAEVTYKTEVLRKANIVLPEKTYYVDSIYVLCNIKELNSYVVFDQPVYYYYIGREGQSMNVESIKRNMDSIITYVKYITNYFEEYKNVLSPNKRLYVEKEVSKLLINQFHRFRTIKYPRNKRLEIANFVKKTSPQIWNNIKKENNIAEAKQVIKKLIGRS